jgi:hypothetical protein
MCPIRSPAVNYQFPKMEENENLKLKVVILTNGGGHWGAYGFAFSDVPLSLSADAMGSMHLDVPGPLKASSVKQQIDAHWWEVFDDES